MRRVFVLGSGFSVQAGAPLARSVLSQIFEYKRQTNDVSKLINYLTDLLFQGRRGWVQETELEEVLSRLDLIRHYRPYPGINYEEVSYYEELLLKQFTLLLSPSRLNCQHTPYSAFGRFLREGDCIISFNYDLVVEDLLTAQSKNFTYNLDLAKPPQGAADPIKLLKLHGSINLYYCELCKKVFYFSPQITDHPLQGQKQKAFGYGNIISAEQNGILTCPHCSTHLSKALLSHFIIAPTLFKSYTLPALRNLWFTALRQLIQADMVVFIGYSLPEADILSYQLFDFGQRLGNSQKQAYLVNGPYSEPQALVDIYGQYLRNTHLYFEDWTKSFSV